jgi:hypothetical protein
MSPLNLITVGVVVPIVPYSTLRGCGYLLKELLSDEKELL